MQCIRCIADSGYEGRRDWGPGGTMAIFCIRVNEPSLYMAHFCNHKWES